MKKLFAMILSLCLLCACCAFAEEEVAELNWADFEEKAAAYPGSFKMLDVWNLVIYVPDSFQAVEATEEQKAAGVFFILQDEAGYRVTGTFQSLGDYDASYLLSELKKAGAEEMKDILVNGIPAMDYDLVANNTKTANLVIYSSEENSFLTISFAPADNEAFQEIMAVMASSIQVAE